MVLKIEGKLCIAEAFPCMKALIPTRGCLRNSSKAGLLKAISKVFEAFEKAFKGFYGPFKGLYMFLNSFPRHLKVFGRPFKGL